MPFQPDGAWLPDLYNKQWDVFNCYARALLVSGPRLSGKSFAVLHRIVRHLWETPNARVAMFTKIMKNSKDAGSWKNLHEYIMPEWIKANIGLVYTTKKFSRRGEEDIPGPKVDGQTRTPFFRIRNMHGGESECMLFSIDNDNDIEPKLKDKDFSMIHFSELTNFMTRQVLALSLPCLRMPHLEYNQQMFIADTNPGEEGESSWIYEAWYVEANLSYEDYCDRQIKLDKPQISEKAFNVFKAGAKLIEIMPKDNPKLKAGQLEEVEASCGFDPGLYARHVEGKWIFGQGDSSRHFRKYYKPSIHVVGSASDPDEDEWEYALPSAGCHDLILGLDPGETNHAGVILEKQVKEMYIPQTGKTVLRGYFTVLDEHVTLKEEISLEHFTLDLMELIVELEAICKRTFPLEHAYADASVEKFSATANTYPIAEIEAAAGGRLMLTAVPKPRHSRRTRVQLLQQLLAYERIKISAHCFHVIRMLKDLKKGVGAANYIMESDQNRHIFDALTYALLMECAEELQLMSQQNTGRRDGLMVSIR